METKTIGAVALAAVLAISIAMVASADHAFAAKNVISRSHIEGGHGGNNNDNNRGGDGGNGNCGRCGGGGDGGAGVNANGGDANVRQS